MENNNNNHCDHSTELQLLRVEVENVKLRYEDYKKEVERWQNQQDSRLDKLEQRDMDFQREATSTERSKYSLHFGAVVTIGAAILAAILALLFSQFGGNPPK